ncbi:MAG: hypothetical protein ACHQTF_08900, partial [Gemmatimonadales bacterium]
ALERSRRVVAGYRGLIGEAVAAGELVGADPARLARSVHAVASGSLGQWVVHREGAAARWVQDDVEALLAPHRPRGQTLGGPRARHRL